MTPTEALRELLERIGANQGAAVLVSEEELSKWPGTAVRTMKKAGLLAPASPASSVVCPGCEQQCTMPVNILPARREKANAFVACDKRDDISRVPIPETMLRQWSGSSTAVAALLCRLLDTIGSDTVAGKRSDLGVLKGRRHSSHVVLTADGGLSLEVAGHNVALCDYLSVNGNSIRLDRQAIVRLVDHPIGKAGDEESSSQRRQRLTQIVRKEKAKGNKKFLKTVAKSEGISVSRLKQILQ